MPTVRLRLNFLLCHRLKFVLVSRQPLALRTVWNRYAFALGKMVLSHAFVVSFVPKKAIAAIILKSPNKTPTAAYEPKTISIIPPRAAPIIAPRLKNSDLIDIMVGRNFGT